MISTFIFLKFISFSVESIDHHQCVIVKTYLYFKINLINYRLSFSFSTKRRFYYLC